MIETLRDFPDNVVAVSCHGHVTRDDYDKVLIPAVEGKLARHDKVRLYYEIGPEFTGIDPGAIWADFKVGMEHLSRWDRVAIVTDVDWIKNTMRFFSFLFPVEMRFFPMTQAAEARSWIAAA